MLKRLLAAMLTVGFILIQDTTAAIAQEPANQHALSAASFQAQLRDKIARMTSLSPKRSRSMRRQ